MGCVMHDPVQVCGDVYGRVGVQLGAACVQLAFTCASVCVAGACVAERGCVARV